MKQRKRIAAFTLAAAMVFSALPINALAVELSDTAIGTGGLCEHHPEHTADCGCTEGSEGTPCTHEHTEDCHALVTECVHEHTEDCYPAQSVSDNTATPSEPDEAEPTGCTHECSEESGCITKKLDCKHEHDSECGYSPATDGTPCTYVCRICNPQGNAMVALAAPLSSSEEYYQDLFTKTETDGVVTYTFSKLKKMSSALVLEPEGDIVIDLTGVTEDTSTENDNAWFSIEPKVQDVTVTVKGTSGLIYNLDIDVWDYPVTVVMDNFSTNNALDFRAGGASTVEYCGSSAVDRIIFGTGKSAEQTIHVKNAGGDSGAHLNLRWISSEFSGSYASAHPESKLILEGDIRIGLYLVCPNVTIQNAEISFAEDGDRYITAKVTEMTDSTIQNVKRISGVVSKDDPTIFGKSSISVSGSTIHFNTSTNDDPALGNAKEITIDNSKIYGASSTSDNACIGGVFETLTIMNRSEVYAESKDNAAIGLAQRACSDDSDYNPIGMASITIENSKVEAASQNGAAIGMPYNWLYVNKDTGESMKNVPLTITISGDSDITATSIHSAAIGGGRAGTLTASDDEKIELGVGAGEIGGWGDGETIGGDAVPKRASRTPAPRISSTEVESKIAKAMKISDNVTISIEGSPIIAAKSGVLAVYGRSVTCDGTNLVQNTMVKESGGNYALYAAESPGAVTIGDETLGELGYGYASVAGTGKNEQTGAGMKFGSSELTDVTTNLNAFNVSSTGWQPFFTYPALVLSGTVQLADENGNPITTGYAASGTKLKADLSGLSPASAQSGSGKVTYQWYRDGVAISNAANNTYTLKADDENNVIYCVVTGANGYTGSVTSSAVTATSDATIPAPTLESRTEDSITLTTISGYQYRVINGPTGNADWQDSPVFTGLTKGLTYTFVQRKGENSSISPAASFSTLSDAPLAKEFAFDYVKEWMSFPSGAEVYSDAECTDRLNLYSGSLSIDISNYISNSGDAPKKLYAKYTGRPEVTEITVPCRPPMTKMLQSDAVITSDSISFPGAVGVSYQLQNSGGTMIGTQKLGDGSTIVFDGLAAGQTYTLKMRVEASNALPNPHFHSDQYDMNLTVPNVNAMTGTILVPANAAGTRGYDLSRWLGSTAITKVTEDNDTDNIVSGHAADGTALTLVTASVGADKTATLEVTAGSKKLTLTVKTVDTVAESDGVLWTRPIYPGAGYIDGGMTDEDITKAWQNKADELSYPADGMASFALRPLNAVGGDLATGDRSVTITWKPSQSASAAFENSSFLLLHIPKSGGDVRQLQYQRGTDALTFTAENQGGLYAVFYKPAEAVDVASTLKSGHTPQNTFALGDTMTVEVIVTKQTPSSATAGIPTGKISVYLGDPKQNGILINSGNLSSINDGGQASIAYTVTEDVVKHGQQQTLYIVYEGDYHFTPQTIAKGVTFNALPPTQPVITAQAGDGSATISWTKPTENGAPITGYKLSVTQNGTPVAASPITVVPTATNYQVTGLTNGTTYDFILTAVNAAGNSTPSMVVTAIPRAAGGVNTGGSGDSNPPPAATEKEDEYDFWQEMRKQIGTPFPANPTLKQEGFSKLTPPVAADIQPPSGEPEITPPQHEPDETPEPARQETEKEVPGHSAQGEAGRGNNILPVALAVVLATGAGIAAFFLWKKRQEKD